LLYVTVLTLFRTSQDTYKFGGIQMRRPKHASSSSSDTDSEQCTNKRKPRKHLRTKLEKNKKRTSCVGWNELFNTYSQQQLVSTKS